MSDTKVVDNKDPTFKERKAAGIISVERVLAKAMDENLSINVIAGFVSLRNRLEASTCDDEARTAIAEHAHFFVEATYEQTAKENTHE